MSSQGAPDSTDCLAAPTKGPQGAGTDPLLGSCLGSFRLTRKLDQGGMGTVYLGEHVDIGSRVAIKVLHPRLSASSQVMRRFRMEARAVNLIGHENIVSVIDINPAPPRPYLVMEYLEGESLSALLARGPVRPEVAVALLTQVCDALEATHAQGIVHRDLKPGNLFLVQRGQGPAFVKVLDFGIAKLMDTEERNTDTAEGAIVGSADYMAPEQSRGERLDGRADLYALGVIAYQLLAGRRPFEEKSLTALLLAHQTKQPIPPHVLRSGVPSALSSVILRALAKDPEDRYQNASTLRGALQVALEQGHARPVTRTTPTTLSSFVLNPALELPVRVTTPGPGATSETLRCTELTRAGMFLCTQRLPPLLSRLRVSLAHPEGELSCECEVVRHVLPDEALTWGMEPGFGVQLMEPSISFKAAMAHLLLGQPLDTLRPPVDPAAEAEVEQVLAPYHVRGIEDLYAVLALATDKSCEELRLRARRAGQVLERLCERPISPALRARVHAVLERVRKAADTLGHPRRRALYDAERGNFAGVVRCLSEGLTVSQLEELRHDFLARHPHSQASLKAHLARARTHHQSGMLALAREDYERALLLDPLSLDLHRQYHAVCRALECEAPVPPRNKASGA
ncbi:serine/threonine protein kinase [Cystobacter fuscus]|uniref:serine/threonine-protein kinase n=1 Tax=Cystobacter fuscus TaxID=43 RepID=UPI002B2FA378|nr:serine/threonine protein kinase [Cystobacter fuscus]